MTHEERLLSFTARRLPAVSCGDRARVNHEYKMSLYSDTCEQNTIQVKPITCMLNRFKR